MRNLTENYIFENVNEISFVRHPSDQAVGVLVEANSGDMLLDLTNREWVLSKQVKSRYSKEQLNLNQLIGVILRYFECESLDKLERQAYKYLNMRFD